MNPKSNIARNIIHFATSNLYRQVLGVLTTFFRPTLLGPELYGLFSLLNILPMYATYGHLGTRTAMRFQIPQLTSTDPDLLANIKQNTLATTVTVNVLVALMVSLYALFYAPAGAHRDGWMLISVVIILNCVYEHYVSELKGYQQFVLVSRITYFRYTANFLFTVFFIYYWSFYGAVMALLLSVLLSLIQLNRYQPFSIPKQIRFETIVQLVKTGAPIVALDLVNVSLKSVDKLLIVLLMGTTALGYYALASMLIGFLMNIPGASREVNEQVLMSEHSSLSVYQQLSEYWLKPMRFTAYFMPILIVGAYYCVPTFVDLVLPDYHHAILPAQLLMVGSYFLALSYPCRGIIVANHWQKQAAKSGAVSVVLSALLIVTTISSGYQLPGVAVSAGAAYFTLFLILSLFIIIRFRQSVRAFSTQMAELMLPFIVMVAGIATVNYFTEQLTVHPVFVSMVALILFMSGYLPLLFLGKVLNRYSLPTRKQKSK
ncbi:MAG TPA: hypothetical protein EYN69_03480 [Flavobacteriales bacterium]|nr:hypothetical protein [Flavobacteriales bacterium]